MISWGVALSALVSAVQRDPSARAVLAYLDPGSGSFLLQLLAAGVLGALFAARVLWSRVKVLFTRKPPKGDNEESQG